MTSHFKYHRSFSNWFSYHPNSRLVGAVSLSSIFIILTVFLQNLNANLPFSISIVEYTMADPLGEKYKKPELQVKFNVIPKTRLKSFSQLFQGYGDDGLCKSDPGGNVMPTVYSHPGNAQEIYQFEPRKDDVWVVTFPKCGNHFYFSIELRQRF